MRKLAAILAFLLFSTTSAFGSITLIAHTTAAGNNGATTGSINTTGADLIVIIIAAQLNKSIATSDSKTNAWSLPVLDSTQASTGANQALYMSWSFPTTVGSGHTFTVSGTGLAAGFMVLAFSGAGGMTNSAFSAGLLGGSVTPPFSNSLIVSGVSCNSTPSSGSFTINSGFTITDQQLFTGGSNYAGAAAYLVQTSPAAVNPNWSATSGTGTCEAGNFVFQPSVSSTTGGSYIAKLHKAPKIPWDRPRRQVLLETRI